MSRIENEETRSSSGATRLLLRFGAILVVVALVVGLSAYLKHRYEEDTTTAVGDWELQLDRIPQWIPGDFEGQLVALTEIPQRVSLRSSHWRRRVHEELENNPWIARVDHLEREGEGIRFRAEFVRPVVGIQARGGYLLCDSKGKVIDFQPGLNLESAWRVPEYRPERGPLDPREDLVLLSETEFEELFSLLEVLWQGGIYERWASVLQRINTRTNPEQDRFWLLEVDRGPNLDWGRAPASRRVIALDANRKLDHLNRTLRYLSELKDVPEIRLWEPGGPLVGVAAGK